MMIPPQINSSHQIIAKNLEKKVRLPQFWVTTFTATSMERPAIKAQNKEHLECGALGTSLVCQSRPNSIRQVCRQFVWRIRRQTDGLWLRLGSSHACLQGRIQQAVCSKMDAEFARGVDPRLPVQGHEAVFTTLHYHFCHVLYFSLHLQALQAGLPMVQMSMRNTAHT